MTSHTPHLVGLGIALLLFTGCANQPPPEAKLPVSNPGYQVDLLFTDETGTSIHRFYDQGDWRYYAVGRNGVAQMLPTTTVHTEVQTIGGGGGIHDHGDHGGHGGHGK